METNNTPKVKITKTERPSWAGSEEAMYNVAIDGEIVGCVRKIRDRNAVMSTNGNYAIGYTEATRWAPAKVGGHAFRDLYGCNFRTRAQAVEKLQALIARGAR